MGNKSEYVGLLTAGGPGLMSAQVRGIPSRVAHPFRQERMGFSNDFSTMHSNTTQ